MKKNIISLKHPENTFIKQPIFRNRKKRCLITQLNQDLMWKIIDCLRLPEIIIFYQCIRLRITGPEIKRYLVNYLVISQRVYSKWEEKQFLDLLINDLQYRWSPSLKRQNSDHKIHTKAQIIGSMSMINLDSSNDKTKALSNYMTNCTINRETLINDIERTYIKFNNTDSSHKNISEQTKVLKIETNQNSEIQKMQEYLSKVLLNIMKKFPRLGYIQGFNFIGKNLFLTGFTENEAVKYLSFLISQTKFGQVLLNSMRGVRQLSYCLKVYIFNYVPAVFQHLQNYDVEPEIFATSWFTTLLAEDLPPRIVNKLWHLFIQFGWKIFIQFGISILCIYQKQILDQSGDEIFSFLRRIMGFFRQDIQKNIKNQEKVWRLMTSVEVNGWIVEQLCSQMDNLQQDTQIQIWKLKQLQRCRSKSQKNSVDQSIQHQNHQSKLKIGSQWCCERNPTLPPPPMPCGSSIMFPFCNNVATTPEL